MHVLVTGATGFLGSHVVPRLLGDGHRVRALVRPSSDVSRLPAAVEIVRGELDAPAAACAGADAVIHLAGIPGTLLRRGDPGRELRRVNVDGTVALFAAACAAGARRGVLVTSMWTALRPDLAARSAYVRARLESEAGAIAAGGSTMTVAILCPTFVVGAGDRGPNMPGSVVRALLRNRMPAIPGEGAMWIAATDAAAAIVAALDRGTPATRYVLGAEYLTYREIARIVAERTGRRAPRVVIPARALRSGGAIADLALAAAGRRAPIPMRDGVEMLCQPAPLDCGASWDALARPQTPVRDAIGDAIAWFRGNGYA